MTRDKLIEIILSEFDFSTIEKGAGIYESNDIKTENGDCISIGIPYEDITDKKDAYVYNLFVGGNNNGEYINISETGDINNKLPYNVLDEMVIRWKE